MLRFTYRAETAAGTRTEFQVDERAASIAHVEAKLEVERWLAAEGESPERLVAFDCVSTRPL